MPHPALQLFLNRLLLRSALAEEERQAILSMRVHPAQVSPNVDIVPPGRLVTYSCLVAEGLAGRFGQLPSGQIGKHTSELQSLMRTSYAVFCLKNKNTQNTKH